MILIKKWIRLNGVNTQNNAYSLPVPPKHSQTRQGNLFMLPFRTVSARQGPCPGNVFSYNNRTKNPVPVPVYL